MAFTEEKFWVMVAFIDWQKSIDYKKHQVRLREWYGAETVEDARDFAHSIREVFDDKRISSVLAVGLGDDGYMDLVGDIISRGEEFTRAVIDDPTVGYAAHEVECFFYCFHEPDPDDYDYEAEAIREEG